MRTVHLIVIHCSATKENETFIMLETVQFQLRFLQAVLNTAEIIFKKKLSGLYLFYKDITREYPEKNYSWRKKTESGQEFLGYGYSITVNNEDYMFGGTVVGRFTTYKQLALILNGKILILSKKAICFNAEE